MDHYRKADRWSSVRVMVFGVLLAVCAAASIAATLRLVATDGYGRTEPPRSHAPASGAPRFHAPPPTLAAAAPEDGPAVVAVEHVPPRRTAGRLVRLFAGLVLYGTAIALLVQAHLGVDPWDLLGQGVARLSGLPFGLVTNLIGAAVLLLWWPLRQRPGVGTLANVLLVGTSAGAVLAVLHPVEVLAVRAGLFAAGMLLLAAATGLYVGAGLGAGPRDGLMLGLHRRTGLPIWVVRSGVEGAAVLLGWLLGGDLGVGTIVFALAIGPLCDVSIRLLAPAERRPLRRPPARSSSASPPRLPARFSRVGDVPQQRVLAPTSTDGVKGPASYFPSIERTYGRPVQEWLDLVVDRLDGHRHMEVVGWLKSEHGLGHGHANALVGYVRQQLAG